jgi:hypothetical protein
MLILTLGFKKKNSSFWCGHPPLVAIEGVHWAKDGPKFSYRVDGCNASYMAKYNLVWHLQMRHNVVMELGKPGCPSTREEISEQQNHETMNACVLNNPLVWFHCNEQKAITKVRRHANLEWGRFQGVLRDTLKVLKPTLVKLASSHMF